MQVWASEWWVNRHRNGIDWWWQRRRREGHWCNHVGWVGHYTSVDCRRRGANGRYVTIRLPNRRRRGGGHLTICEVEVLGCRGNNAC